MNLVHASLSVSKDPVSTFHSCGGPVKLVHAFLNGGKGLENKFHHCRGPKCRKQFSLCGSPVKLVRDSISARKGIEDNFHHCGSPAKLVHTCLNVRREGPWNQFSPLWRSCVARSHQFECQERCRKQFSLCGSPVKLGHDRTIFTTVKVLSCSCMHVRVSGGTFLPLWRSCEACAVQFECQE